MWVLTLNCSSDYYNTNWTKIYKKKKNAQIEYKEVITNQYKMYCDNDDIDETLTIDEMLNKIYEMQSCEDDFEIELSVLKTED